MIQQYKKEMSKIHAPAYLVERTKEAMRREEEKLKEELAGLLEKPGSVSDIQKKSNRKKIAISFLAVAAVLLVVLMPNMMKDTGVRMQTQKPLQLAPKEMSDLQIIEYERAKESMPEDITDEESGEETYFILKDEKTKNLKAFVEINGNGYVISGELEDEESFLQEAEKLLHEK